MNEQKIYTVKLSFPYEWPIMRQTPNWSGKWGNYQFLLNDAVDKCDFWIIFSKHNLKKEFCDCPPENIIFMPSEAFSIDKFSEKFLKQFALIITCQREIVHRNVSYNLGAHPWFVGKSYDELIGMGPVEKTRKVSLITSNKVMTDGHKKRLEFAYKLKDHFKDDVDLWGRGIKDFDDKWDVVAPYQYSIAIENDYCDDWLTEKFFDCQLAYTFPFYYGCPNAEKYYSPDSFKRIDINNLDGSIKIIEGILSDDSHYEKHLEHMHEAKMRTLNNYNLFPLLVSYMSNMNGDAARQNVSVSPEFSIKSLLKSLKQIVKR